MLAGGAPLHLERLAARGGPADRALDPLNFYDTSSYGPRAIDAMLRAGRCRPARARLGPPGGRAGGVGPLGEAVVPSLRERNPARLLGAPTVVG